MNEEEDTRAEDPRCLPLSTREMEEMILECQLSLFAHEPCSLRLESV